MTASLARAFARKYSHPMESCQNLQRLNTQAHLFFADTGRPFLETGKKSPVSKIGHDLYSSDTRYSLLLKIQTPQSSHSQRANFCFLIVRLRPIPDPEPTYIGRPLYAAKKSMQDQLHQAQSNWSVFSRVAKQSVDYLECSRSCCVILRDTLECFLIFL